MYAGAPDCIESDAGSNFTAQEFKDNAKSMGIDVKIAPVESHDRIGKVERQHKILNSCIPN